MEQILLQKLTLQNFQKFTNQTFEFGQVTQISGENGAGKTTIYSALTWLLFGKDSKGRATGKGGFEIKPIIDGSTVHHVDTSVIGYFTIAGNHVKIQRQLTEDWTKGKDARYKGDCTQGFVDDVPYKITDFEDYISKTLLNEDEFRMITDIGYFLSLSTDYKRKYLCSMAGVRDIKEIGATKADWQTFLDSISGKSLEDALKQIDYERKDLKEQYDEIDPSIKALEESKPETLDWDQLNAEKENLSSQIDSINSALSDKNKISEQKENEIEELRKKSSKLGTEFYNNTSEIQKLKNKLEQDARQVLAKKDEKRNELIGKVSTLNRSIKSKEDNLLIAKNDLEHFETKKKELFDKYKTEKDKTFESDETQTVCPLLKGHICNSPELLLYIKKNQEQAEKDFNANRVDMLASIMASGKEAVAKVDELNEEIANIESEIKSIRQEIAAAQTIIDSMPIYSNQPIADIKSNELNRLKEESIRLNGKKNDIENQIEALQHAGKIDNSDLLSKRKDLQGKQEIIIKQLGIKDQIESIENQIKGYNNKGKDLAKRITELDNKELIVKDINRTVVEDATERVNQLFTLIKWQLFELQKNGLYAECCKPTINGVSISLNTGSVMNGGIDIVNTICQFKNICAPIFIDNAESVNEPMQTVGQAIYLSVSCKGTKLTIKNIK
jgi:DNA repair exonuclease SbcCD ATPase subunit